MHIYLAFHIYFISVHYIWRVKFVIKVIKITCKSLHIHKCFLYLFSLVASCHSYVQYTLLVTNFRMTRNVKELFSSRTFQSDIFSAIYHHFLHYFVSWLCTLQTLLCSKFLSPHVRCPVIWNSLVKPIYPTLQQKNICFFVLIALYLFVKWVDKHLMKGIWLSN